MNKKKIIIFAGGSGTKKLSEQFFKEYLNKNFDITNTLLYFYSH